MSTADSTAKSSSESSLRKSSAAYTPGGLVFSKKPRQKQVWRFKADKRDNFPGCNEDTLNQILQILMNSKQYLAVIKLAMVNKWFREIIGGKYFEVWRPMFMSWRTSHGRHPAPMCALRRGNGQNPDSPSHPRYGSLTYINFKTKVVSRNDYAPGDLGHYNLRFYKKTAVLVNVRCCGMCGSTRHPTDVFWALNMRLCRYCCHDNFISDTVLQERYWISISSRVLESSQTFVEAVAGRAYFFRSYCTPKERLNYSDNPIDFASSPNFIFFWKPHLDRLLDLKSFESEAAEKHRAASILRAYTRRSLVRRVWATNCGKSIRDRRPALYKLHRLALREKATLSWLACYRVSSSAANLLNKWEDMEVREDA